MRKIERVQVSREILEEIRDVITGVIPNYNPETGEADGHTFTIDGVKGFIVQSNNIVFHRADGSLKCWYTKDLQGDL